MSDDDRILATGLRILDNGCTNCNHSKVYCHCVAHLDGPDARCCDTCTHH